MVSKVTMPWTNVEGQSKGNRGEFKGVNGEDISNYESGVVGVNGGAKSKLSMKFEVDSGVIDVDMK